jgi:DNA-binding protein
MKKVLVFIILFSWGIALGQLKYERKSISYANAVIVSDPSIRIEPKEATYLVKKLREYIEMPRFDYNPIPNELLEDFTDEIEARGTNVSLDEVVEILKQKFVPKIIEILDIEKEIRAQNLLTEEQRNSFIATKAKALGITAEQALKIMNSAFIYIPVISKYNSYVDNVNQLLTVNLNAGVIWYRVVYKESGEGDLSLVVKKETRGIGVAKIGEEFKHEGEKIDYKDYAFRTAVIALARDIQVATRDIPEFRLGAQVMEVYSNTVTFPMGKREGIKVDDGFDLVELQEDPNGGVVQRKIGFARVINVADNRSNSRALSRARVIFGRGLEPGIYVSERPRLPIDLYVRILNNPFTVKHTYLNWWTGEKETKTYTMAGYSIQAELLYNIGRNVNISQLWIGVGIYIGSGDAEKLDIIKAIFREAGYTEKPDVSILGFNGILMKKFYIFNRFVATGKAELIIENVNFTKGDAKLGHSGLGLGFGIGAEYTATPDLNLGFNLGYRMFSESEEWEGAFTSATVPGLAGDHSGFAFSFYVNYSFPKLGFDPIAAIRGALGW